MREQLSQKQTEKPKSGNASPQIQAAEKKAQLQKERADKATSELEAEKKKNKRLVKEQQEVLPGLQKMMDEKGQEIMTLKAELKQAKSSKADPSQEIAFKDEMINKLSEQLDEKDQEHQVAVNRSKEWERKFEKANKQTSDKDMQIQELIKQMQTKIGDQVEQKKKKGGLFKR